MITVREEGVVITEKEHRAGRYWMPWVSWFLTKRVDIWMFTLPRYFKLYTHDLCTILCVCNCYIFISKILRSMLLCQWKFWGTNWINYTIPIKDSPVCNSRKASSLPRINILYISSKYNKTLKKTLNSWDF